MPAEPTPSHSSPPTPPSSGGWIDDNMSKIFGRSWRTGLAGFATFVCGIAPFVPTIPPVVQHGCQIAIPLLMGTGLLAAKDSKVSGPPK